MQKNTTIMFGVLVYALIRIFSYFFAPETLINTIASIGVLVAAGYLLIKANPLGWLIVAGEIILGGAGNFLSIGPLALRTALLLASITIWKTQKLLRGELLTIFKSHKEYCYVAVGLFLIVILGAINGLLKGHEIKNIFSQVIPYAFLFYYFPLLELLKNELFKEKLLHLIYAAIAGCTLFTLGTFVAYTTHLFVLQDSYYHWFRDIAGGKITDLTNNFFRIVLNEHLLLIPLLLFFAFKKGKPAVLQSYYPTALLMALYAVNLTRAYLLGLIGALIVVNLFKRSWQTVRTSIAVLLGIVLVFAGIHVLSSSDHSLGLEFFGIRIGSIVAPNTEASALSRLLLLPIILEKIADHPIVGTGLGETITVYSPVLEQIITTTQFDWGFLQIQVELGILGTLAWLCFLAYLTLQLLKNRQFVEIGILVSISIATITGPVLFHVLGILCLVVLYASLPANSRT